MAGLIIDQSVLQSDTNTDGTDDNVVLRLNQTLKLETAVEILNNTDQYKIVNQVPEYPKGGDVFLLIPHQPGEEECWKNDGYRWCHYGPKMVPGKNPTVQKRYYAAYMSNGKVSKFHKNVYQLINDDRDRIPIVVHYFGDHSVAAQRDMKSRDNNGIEKSSEHQYSKFNNNDRSNLSVHRALKPKPVKKCIINKEEFRELHQIAQGLGNYVRLISHYPDVIIVFAMKEISDDLENLIKFNQESRPLFSYSNSYELGEFIVSTFLFTHPAFVERPTIPSHFVIHEKSCGLAHQEMCRILAQMVPSLTGSSNPVVLNLDPNKFSAISTVFPSMHTLFSWKDVIANTKAWLYANGASQQEVTVYIEDLRQLFSRRSKELYEEALEECKTRWHGFFEEYYMKEIHEVVNDRLGRWALEKWNVYNPYTGVTDKSNEGMEVVIRQLKMSGAAPAYSTVLALCILQRWLYHEISKSYSGIGPFSIRAEFQALQRSSLEDFTATCPPDQIMFYIQNKRALISEGILKEDCVNSELKMNLQTSAAQLVKAGAIVMNSKQQSFTVKVNPVAFYEVKLFPKVSCTCDDVRNGLCCHVLAVKMSLGINIEEDLRKYQPNRNVKVTEVKNVRKLKRETSVDNIAAEMQVPVKRSKEISEDEISMHSSSELIASQNVEMETSTHAHEQDTEGDEIENANNATATHILQGSIDDASQLQLMQIAASTFRQDVSLNL